jgi:hypothetical protein
MVAVSELSAAQCFGSAGIGIKILVFIKDIPSEIETNADIGLYQFTVIDSGAAEAGFGNKIAKVSHSKSHGIGHVGIALRL